VGHAAASVFRCFFKLWFVQSCLWRANRGETLYALQLMPLGFVRLILGTISTLERHDGAQDTQISLLQQSFTLPGVGLLDWKVVAQHR
jgi:hypothetical protein